MRVTVLILTLNEEVNLPYALRSVVDWADQIIVVDSFSQDSTVEIAKSFGAEVYQNKFVNHVQQRNWALEVPKYRNEWVLYIDADEQVTPELRDEISKLESVPDEVAGFEMRRRFVFLGRWLKHGGYYSWILRLLRLGRSRFVTSARAGEYAVVQGAVRRLHHDLLHQDHRSLAQWIQNQNKDSSKIALALYEAGGEIKAPELLPGEVQEGRFRAWVNRILQRLPIGLNPLLRFCLFYFVRMGFLDGWQGFAYCALHEFWMPLVISLKMREFPMSPYALEEARRSGWR
ncbi:MAG: glycosyltransferase family 2 protein [Candidatus Methanomethyliaceae archaeon]